MYKATVAYVKTQLETKFSNVYVGEQDWESIMKINKDVVEILPSTGTRNPEGMSGIGTEQWDIQINVARKGTAMTSEDMEIVNLENMMTVVDLFKNKSAAVTVSGTSYPVRFDVTNYDASRVLLKKEEGKGFYVTACAVTVQTKITR